MGFFELHWFVSWQIFTAFLSKPTYFCGFYIYARALSCAFPVRVFVALSFASNLSLVPFYLRDCWSVNTIFPWGCCLVDSSPQIVQKFQRVSWLQGDMRLTRQIGSLVHRATEMRQLVLTRLSNCAVELTNQREAFHWIWAQFEVTASEINRSHLALSSCGPRITLVITCSVKISGVNFSDFDCSSQTGFCSCFFLLHSVWLLHYCRLLMSWILEWYFVRYPVRKTLDLFDRLVLVCFSRTYFLGQSKSPVVLIHFFPVNRIS